MADGVPGSVNPLDFLHKLSIQRSLQAPQFKQLGEQGPAHMKTFVWTCNFYGLEAQGVGRSKKEAKIAAAKALKDQIDLNALPPVSEKKRKASPGKEHHSAGPNPPSRKKKKTDMRHPGQKFGGFFPGQGFGPNGALPVAFAELYADVGPEGGVMAPMQCPPGGYGGGPVFCSRLSKLDRYVIQKHKDIYPTEAELSSILQLVRDTEESMRQVAEVINKPEGEVEGAEAKSEVIKGMVRVGDLAKGLLLKDTNHVKVVLMCQKPPTKALLATVIEKLKLKIKELHPDKAYVVLEKSEFGHLSVVLPPSDDTADTTYICDVTFTSVSLRKKFVPPPVAVKEENSSADGDAANVTVKKEVVENNGKAAPVEEPEVEYDPKTCLPKDKCLKALSDLRHSRWFASMALNLPSCVECIRLIKDLAKRDTAWAALSDWNLELLVERALFSAHVPLNPAASIMRVMEVVASGILLDLNQGLLDPCEHEKFDVTSGLSVQQRENLTKTAQHYLRMMHFRQIHKVLDMDQELDDYRPRYNRSQPATDPQEVKTETANGNGTAVATENGAAA